MKRILQKLSATMIHCPNGSPTALFNEVVAPKFRSNEACTATQKVIATATERIVPAILQTPFTKPRLTPSSIPKIMIAKKRMSKTLAVFKWIPNESFHDFIASSSVVGKIFESQWFIDATL